MLVNHWGSIRCREKVGNLMILKNRRGIGGGGTSLSDVRISVKLISLGGKEPQIPPLGLKSSVGMTRSERKSEWRKAAQCRYTTLSGAAERTCTWSPAFCSASRTPGEGSMSATSCASALRL